MRRFLAFLPLLILAVALADVREYRTTDAQALPPNTYLETVAGSPSSPLSGPPDSLFKTLYSNSGGITLTSSMGAQHDSNCSGPEGVHTVDDNAETVFRCRDHVMTAVNSPGTVKVYLTADHMADFSQGTATIRWNMSTYRTSSRDWVDFAIMPFDDHYQAWGQNGLTPRNGITLTMENQVPGQSRLVGSVFRNFQRTGFGQVTGSRPYEAFLTPDKARRDTFQIELSRDRIRVSMPDYNAVWIDAAISPPLDWTQGIVQWNHAAYNPGKDDSQWCRAVVLGPNDAGHCGANTWHWGNFYISPAVPYTVIKADREYTRFGESRVTFQQPAPSGAWLQFIAVANNAAGRPLDLSFDGGHTWQRAVMLPLSGYAGDEWYKSYWQQIPAGVQSVEFRAADNNWIARDFAILSQGSTPVAEATGTPAALPTPTVPVVSPTTTASATGTPTPDPTGTPTSVPGDTPTAVPTVTPTPTLLCTVALFRGDDLIHGPPTPCPL